MREEGRKEGREGGWVGGRREEGREGSIHTTIYSALPPSPS